MKDLIAQQSSAKARRGWKKTSGSAGKDARKPIGKISGHGEFSKQD